MEQFVLTGQDKPFAPFFFCLLNSAANQLSRVAFFAAFGNRIDAKNHLPRTVFVVQRCIFIHFIRQIRRIRHHTVHLLEAGQRAPALGVVLAGRVHMEHLDVWGSKTLLGQAGPGDLFAETYACLPDEPLRVSVVAAENGEALFLETGQLLQCGCEPWRWKLTQNLLRIAARKNLGLAQRSLYTAPKTIRGRITAYFSVLARQNGSLRFTLPFDRQQLADHLGVDRSALSNALSQMQKEGLLVIDKREVELKQVEEM